MPSILLDANLRIEKEVCENSEALKGIPRPLREVEITTDTFRYIYVDFRALLCLGLTFLGQKIFWRGQKSLGQPLLDRRLLYIKTSFLNFRASQHEIKHKVTVLTGWL